MMTNKSIIRDLLVRAPYSYELVYSKYEIQENEALKGV